MWNAIGNATMTSGALTPQQIAHFQKQAQAALPDLQLLDAQSFSTTDTSAKLGGQPAALCAPLNARYTDQHKQFQDDLSATQTRLSALSEVHQAYAKLADVLPRFQDLAVWNTPQVTITSADGQPATGYVTVQCAPGTEPTSFHLQATALAPKHSLQTTPLEAPGTTQPLGLPEGTLSLNGRTIALTPTTTLKELTATINQTCHGDVAVKCLMVSAPSTGTPGRYKLLIQSQEAGQTPHITDSTNGTIMTRLGLATPAHMPAPAQPVVQIEGTPLTLPSNTFSPFEGITLTLLAPTPAAGLNIEVAPNATALAALLEELVAGLRLLEEATHKHCPQVPGLEAPLASLPQLRLLLSDIGALLPQADIHQTHCGFRRVAGFLVFDQKAFLKAFEQPDAVRDLFVQDPLKPDSAPPFVSIGAHVQAGRTLLTERMHTSSAHIDTIVQGTHSLQTEITETSRQLRLKYSHIEMAAQAADAQKRMLLGLFMPNDPLK